MDKGVTLSPNTHMLTSGPLGDQVNFGEHLQKNLKLNQLRNGQPPAAAGGRWVWPGAGCGVVRGRVPGALRSHGGGLNPTVLICAPGWVDRTGTVASPWATANYVRHSLATALRSKVGSRALFFAAAVCGCGGAARRGPSRACGEVG